MMENKATESIVTAELDHCIHPGRIFKTMAVTPHYRPRDDTLRLDNSKMDRSGRILSPHIGIHSIYTEYNCNRAQYGQIT